jgi:hypothetical protein
MAPLVNIIIITIILTSVDSVTLSEWLENEIK